ncbi:MAG: hypothetical protein GC192_08700 [Bacteroidetes bacterium]|nr:hypothetical protein [Bacteroidota bacterium]
MKKALVIFIAGIIFISSMSNVLLLAEFKLNQAEIERLYCVNKAQPQKHCNGKCHLRKQLIENNSRNNKPSPLSELEQTFKINFFHQLAWSVPQVFSEDKSVQTPVCTTHFHSRLFGKCLFQPPDYQPTA